MKALQPVQQPLAGQGRQIQRQPRGPVQSGARQQQAQNRAGQYHQVGHGQPEHVERKPKTRIAEEQKIQRQQGCLDQQ